LLPFPDPGTGFVMLDANALNIEVLTRVTVALQANVVSVMRFELFWTCMHCGSDVPEVRLRAGDLLMQL
jgi:hypothetical protein